LNENFFKIQKTIVKKLYFTVLVGCEDILLIPHSREGLTVQEWMRRLTESLTLYTSSELHSTVVSWPHSISCKGNSSPMTTGMRTIRIEKPGPFDTHDIV
jgi:hypothetical protein